MEIPYTELSAEALRAIIEEFITREGTDYGQIEYAMEEKVRQIENQLRNGEVVITFDASTESCSLQRVK